MTSLSRRTLVSGALATAGITAFGGHASGAPKTGPSLVVSRGTLPSGVQSGDVTTNSAVVWARNSQEGRLVVSITRGRGSHRVELRGPWASPATDFTAQLALTGLTQGTDYEYWAEFEDAAGHRGERGVGHFRTADQGPKATSLIWTGDTAGQGWGINPDLGGMVAYQAMLATNPDVFIHSGDNIYGDNPILPQVIEPDGQVWRNIVQHGVDHVAETLDDYRGRYRYNQLDANIRALYAAVPVLSQGDDHETRNNWYPGQILTDPRYTEKRVDVLSARARQAFFENMPLSTGPSVGGKVYRQISRGRMLDVFMLDERTYRGPNTTGLEPTRQPFMGAEQVDWLLAGLSRSSATWKVVASDMPIGIIVPDGANIEAIANRDPGAPLGRELEMAYLLREIKRRRIRNVVWLTADVHYCATHLYDPTHAALTDFDPFYEFVAGPISAGSFGPNQMDATFGPQVLYQGLPRYQNQSPRDQKAMFFGHCDFDKDANLTVTLRNGLGETVHSTELQPSR